eukprot:6107292-Alexandrium_andersonii.AAC.1
MTNGEYGLPLATALQGGCVAWARTSTRARQCRVHARPIGVWVQRAARSHRERIIDCCSEGASQQRRGKLRVSHGVRRWQYAEGALPGRAIR